jgi:hypothetical protein
MKSYQFILYQRLDAQKLKEKTGSLKTYCLELIRPWKLFSFTIGLCFLLYGAWAWDFSDWNWLNSVVMALLTYFLAPWSVMHLRSIWIKQSRFWQWKTLWAIFFWIFTVDTSYTLCNHILHYPVFHLANFPASSVLFFTCGFLWSYQATLSDLIYDLTHIKVSI